LFIQSQSIDLEKKDSSQVMVISTKNVFDYKIIQQGPGYVLLQSTFFQQGMWRIGGRIIAKKSGVRLRCDGTSKLIKIVEPDSEAPQTHQKEVPEGLHPFFYVSRFSFFLEWLNPQKSRAETMQITLLDENSEQKTLNLIKSFASTSRSGR
jgi:hypothetical protein